MSLILAVIAVALAVFDLGININFLFSQTFAKKNIIKIPDEELRRQQREAERKERENIAFNNYTPYEK
nr:MAG TPA: hypothetical protein [Caudoviricetes sp.]